ADAVSVEEAIDRWRDVGVEPALPTVRPTERPAQAPSGSAPRPSGPAAGPPTASESFHAFAAREAEGVLAALDAALHELRDRPLDREPLKSILRRQRALLGAAALDSLPALAETLHVVDEVTRLVARRNPAVTGDWLEPYTAARDTLTWAVPRIRAGESLEDGPPAMTRLRQARDRLVAAHAETTPTEPAPPEPPTQEISPDDVAAFRSEAADLLARVRRMTEELATATPDRRKILRRELREVLTALSNNARTFRMSDAAALALTGRAWLEAGDPAALDSLLERLRERLGIEADSPVDDEAARQRSASPQPEESKPQESAPQESAPEESAPDLASSPVSASRTEPAPPREPVPIEDLVYRGEAALRRALELRPALEAAVEGDPDARERLDELFDLIRLALG
ncbi:MAG: hypothetical protein ACODAE_06605, partial [Gemmatimonadota bacterium]